MKTFCLIIILLVIPLALASASRVSSLAVAARESGASTPATVDREQPADVRMHERGVEGGWRRVVANETKLVAVRGWQGRGFRKGARRCIAAAACIRRKVICGKRCYTARSRLAGVPPATKCVIRCKKCLPTC